MWGVGCEVWGVVCGVDLGELAPQLRGGGLGAVRRLAHPAKGRCKFAQNLAKRAN